MKPPPKDISAKWYRGYFYFNSKYRCPSVHCISEFFENKFARMEYVGEDKFNLSYMRHTGKWHELYQEISLNECLTSIREGPNFFP